MGSKGFDISALSYEELVEYLFTSPQAEAFGLDPDGNEYWFPEITHPEVVLRNLAQFCTQFRQLAGDLSLEALDHGINGMLNPAYFQLQTVLWNNALDLSERVRCIRMMYQVFADYVAAYKVGAAIGGLYMWWDFVCTSFWFAQTYRKKLAEESYELLPEHDRSLVDTMFETLVEILKLNDERTNACALHGLGHLHHPEVQSVVQRFIDTHSATFDARGIGWLEKCRDGKVM